MLTPFGPLPNRLAAEMSLAEQHEWLQRPVSRRALLRGSAALGASSVLLWAQPDRAVADPSRVYGRHTAFGADPTTDMIVGFASQTPVRSASVHLDKGHMAPTEIRTVPGASPCYMRAEFTGLTPDTEYRYSLHADGASVGSGRFRTAPAGRPAFRFTAFGDQDVDPEAVGVLTQLARARPLFHLHAGDTCYADSSGKGGVGGVFRPDKWDRWLRQNDPVASWLPWMVVPGNHEMEPGFATHGYAGMLSRIPVGGKSPVAVPVATSFRIGTVGFVGLDSNDVANEIPANRGWTQGRQTAWLEQELARYRNTPMVDFVVVFLHASPYCTSASHGSEGGVREHWVPLFDKYSVDLVIAGHNHCYQRALPLRGGRVVSSDLHTVDAAAGTTYVTVGGGGAAFDAVGFGHWPNATRVATSEGAQSEPAPWSRAPRGLENSVLVVDVRPSSAGAPARMQLRAVTRSGGTADEWQIVRHNPHNSAAAGSGSSSWLWPDGAAALAGLGAAGVAGATVAARRARRPQPVPGTGANEQV